MTWKNISYDEKRYYGKWKHSFSQRFEPIETRDVGHFLQDDMADFYCCKFKEKQDDDERYNFYDHNIEKKLNEKYPFIEDQKTRDAKVKEFFGDSLFAEYKSMDNDISKEYRKIFSTEKREARKASLKEWEMRALRKELKIKRGLDLFIRDYIANHKEYYSINSLKTNLKEDQLPFFDEVYYEIITDSLYEKINKLHQQFGAINPEFYYHKLIKDKEIKEKLNISITPDHLRGAIYNVVNK